MIRSKMLLRALMTLLAIAVIAMPASGAHLHLCFDGHEAPSTLHLSEDGAEHPQSGTDSHDTHQDTDVQLGTLAIAKKADGAFDLPGLMAVTFVVFRLSAPEPFLVDRPVEVPVVAVPLAFQILPPLRGPPV